jgi:hypothetical protein
VRVPVLATIAESDTSSLERQNKKAHVHAYKKENTANSTAWRAFAHEIAVDGWKYCPNDRFRSERFATVTVRQSHSSFEKARRRESSSSNERDLCCECQSSSESL